MSGASPASGPTGVAAVTLTGNHLATTQEPTFDGTPARFTVASDQMITATAPPRCRHHHHRHHPRRQHQRHLYLPRRPAI
ncbi:IPT/TIG domain-containing protein [Streptomyces sp. CBMA123]|uniref:IPT/TIG domain-containing protein n=1 Tax=Streptomyces sp. CBMA123 TaxID=1896313 RepID=UPI001661F84D|nr:IPT/TIG domain-containing protein [Streptomyces sp. CBMA123]